MGAACPGPENQPWREARAAYAAALAAYDPLDPAQSRPVPADITPWPGEPVWCAGCASVITTCLAELDYLIAMRLAPADGHRASAAAERVSGSADDASPSPACDDEDETVRMLTGWESAWRDVMGLPSLPRKGGLASAGTMSIAYLRWQLPDILRSAIAGDFGAEMIQWHRELSRAVKAGARTLRQPMRCPNPLCGWLVLFWTEGEDVVECHNPNCRLVMSYRECQAEMERLAAQLQDGALA